MTTDQERQEIKLFLALLFPWDEEHASLYKTVTWTFTGKDGQIAFANYAAQSLDALMKLIETRIKRSGANVYIALGTQRMASVEKFSSDGYPAAIRRHNNIVSFNSVYLDIDVGKPGAYATTEDAFAALDDFCTTLHLPKPTIEVNSGSGGLHVYWCFNRPVPVIQWMELAKGLRNAALNYGLKFDPQCTVNPAGILRIPNSFNHKKSPPGRVLLYRDPGHEFPRYDFQQLVGIMGTYLDSGTSDLHREGGRPNHERTKNFTDGVTEESPPVSIHDVGINCPTIDDILNRGGKGDSEPLWNMALYAAAFTDDPMQAAHELSFLDPRYTKDGTDKKLAEKINARAANPQAGWPTCEGFHGAGSTKCATCPLFAQKKTPFHHARRPDHTTVGYTPKAGQDELMPEGYWRSENNHVWTTVFEGKAGVPRPLEVIPYPILDGGLDPDDNTILLYKATVRGVTAWHSIDFSLSLQPAQAAAAFAKGGLVLAGKLHGPARDFKVAWVQHLQHLKRTTHQSSYGWTADGKAFCFDDKVYHEDHTDVVFRGKQHNPIFSEVGKLKPWQDAMALVYGNAPLEVAVATAFAAPLVELVGPYSLVTSLYSSLSGIGKSTSLMLAQAVWGHPRSGMSTLADTENAMMKKIGDLKNLPVYWDELRTKDQLEKVISIVFQITQGKGKARMKKDTSLEDVATFTTMFTVASNHGIIDTVYSQTESTEAGGLRVFEIEAGSLKATMPDHVARQILMPLQTNHGVAGARYAEFLAKNRAVAKQTVDAVAASFAQTHQFSPKERYWSMTATTIMSGAILANLAGLTNFDLGAIRDCLGQVLGCMRGELKLQEYSTMVATQDVVGLLNEMQAEGRGKYLLLTETIPYGQVGKPVPVKLVDTALDDLVRQGDVWLQVGANDGRIRARARPFNEWLRKRRLDPRQIRKALGAHYHVSQTKQGIGVGVTGLSALSQARTACYDFTPLSGGASPSPDS